MKNRALSLSLLALLPTSAYAGGSLVAHYPLDGDARDYSSGGNHGTTANGVTYATGVCGSAATLNGAVGSNSFDPSGQHVAIPYQALGDFSVSAWFNQSVDTGSWQRVWDFAGGGGFFLAVNHDRLGGRLGVGVHSADGASVEDIGSGIVPTNGTWYHVVVTYDQDTAGVDGAGTTIYVNGVRLGQGSYDSQSFTDFTNQHWYLGRSNWADPYFNGRIDEVRIYDGTLDLSEIQALYVAGNTCTDADGDGIGSTIDNCPSDSNPDQADGDADGIGDVCDACPADSDNDADSDGKCGDLDNCPADANPTQSDIDGDTAGDACDEDIDGDGIDNSADNCPLDDNADQEDADGDGIGAACEGDSDLDSVNDDIDECLSTPAGEPVLDTGCSIDQTCACEDDWKNHGAYVRCVAQATEELVSDGVISGADKGRIVSSAARSSCGK